MITLDVRRNGEVWYCVARVLSFRTRLEAVACLIDYIGSL